MRDFDSIYADYYDLVFRYIRSLCRDSSLAEEVTQEAFFRALKNLKQFRGQCKLEVWLCQIAKYTLFAMQKKQMRQTGIVDEPQSPGVETAFLQADEARRAHGALHQLPEPYREVFWMRVFGEMSFAETGALFEKSESWARVTYYRARIKLREELK